MREPISIYMHAQHLFNYTSLLISTHTRATISCTNIYIDFNMYARRTGEGGGLRERKKNCTVLHKSNISCHQRAGTRDRCVKCAHIRFNEPDVCTHARTHIMRENKIIEK